VPEAEVGRGTVDTLVSVWLLDGREEWLLIHVEVQSQHDAAFPERMYTYNHRLTDRYGRMPVSLAILGDESGVWRPQSYTNGTLGCEIRFTFPIAKLIDYRSREFELVVDPNPFAAVTLAHVKALETRGDPTARYAGKLTLVKGLYDRGLTKEQVLRLFRLMDWMLKLPHPLRRQFAEEIDMYEKDKQMPLLSPTEQMWRDDAVAEGQAEGLAKGQAEGLAKGQAEGLAKGLVEGLMKGIALALALRFGDEGVALIPHVRQITDHVALDAFLNAIKAVPDLNALRNMLPVQHNN
jgi:hypothetical protein